MEHAALTTLKAGAAAAMLAAWGMAVATAQQTPAAPVFTARQAIAGRAAYAKSCGSCHMPDLSGSNEIPPLAGEAFMSTWGGRSTKELFDYLSAAMPYGAPSLSTGTYADIAAFLLQSNGAVAGHDELSASTEVPIGSLAPPRRASPAIPSPPPDGNPAP